MRIFLIAAVALFAQIAWSADENEVKYPADNASEIVPPHEARGYTYAKGDPFERMFDESEMDADEIRRNEISAGEYGWQEYDRCASCEPQHEYACADCAHNSDCDDCAHRYEVRYEHHGYR
ncbi:MAG TPA: hypothetical protein VEJ63_11080 [Planctomycetota bacterium]|nr:hypothetical protein [Planctomycetota bacterium]